MHQCHHHHHHHHHYIIWNCVSAGAGVITLNLPQDEVLALSAKLSIMAAIICSYPLQLYVLVSVLMPSIVQPRAPPHLWTRLESEQRKPQVASRYVFISFYSLF